MRSLCILLLILASCGGPSRHEEKTSTEKKSRIPKTDLQFISIAYMDVFGKAIPQQELNSIKEVFLSQGDRELNRKALIIKLLQNQPETLPGENILAVNPESFLRFCFKQFYRRVPSNKELTELLITHQEDPLTASDWYLAFMMSDEYQLL